MTADGDPRASTSPQVSDPAPDFELDGSGGRFRLSEQRGKRVVLFFYPGDNSLVCTRQFCAYRDQIDQFDDLQVLAVGISAQSVASHQAFIAEHALTVPLLADPDFLAAKAYGVHSRLIGTKRATFVIDESGVIRYRHDNMLSLTYDTVERLTRVLANLDGSLGPPEPADDPIDAS